MKLPERLDQLLRQNDGLASLVLRAITVFEPWARDNKTIFFPEYTDHSLVHMMEVLAAADSLICDQAWPHLTPEDAATIVLAGLLHDCALHLSEQGFFSLIEGRYLSRPSRYVKSEPPWPALWDSFFTEARRFDQRKLFALFGDVEPVKSIPRNALDLTLKHRLLIGEFLRRHHARLAHEIALSGIPGPGAPIAIADDRGSDFLDLSGYVARSHNMTIRSAIDGLEPAKRRVILNCRAPFAMVVLRIADYLQIHSARAPGELLRLKSLSSPISRNEWSKHSAVREINQAHEDPEAIFVDCEPESASTFIATRNLFRDIQSELDQCWAALGEVYGRFSPLNNLGITIRRIKSNIDDPEHFRVSRNPSYLPRDFRFKTSSAELMDLLVTPLYGARPEIGVRELVQNAVDACLERDDLAQKGLIERESAFPDDVVVTLRSPPKGPPILIVEDFGVGMTPDIVDNYFLNVGASFRSSDLWRRNHEVDGHSTIHRSGRFGIGLLAAFLLGKVVKVTTRHIAEPTESGITFACAQGSEVIEVRPCSFHAGTRIEIELSSEAARALEENYDDWDWYCLSEPRVRRLVIDESERTLSQRRSVPECDADISETKWRRILADGYDDILWSYEAVSDAQYWNRSLVCNGIFVTDSLYGIRPGISPGLDLLEVSCPSLVVFDPDGRFPINLQRDKIVANKLPFDRALTVDISEFVSLRIIQAVGELPAGVSRELVALSVEPRIPGLWGREYGSTRKGVFLITSTGVVPGDAELIRELRPDCVLVDAVSLDGERGAFSCPAVASAGIPYLAVDRVTDTKTSRTAFLRDSIGALGYLGQPTGYFAGLKILGRRLFVRKEDVRELVAPGKVPKSHWNRLRHEHDVGEYDVWVAGPVPPVDLDFTEVAKSLAARQSLGFTLIYFDWRGSSTSESTESSPFAFVWRRIVGGPVLVQRKVS